MLSCLGMISFGTHIVTMTSPGFKRMGIIRQSELYHGADIGEAIRYISSAAASED
jgi:hypothetical protein